MADSSPNQGPSHVSSTIVIATAVPSLVVIIFLGLVILKRRRATYFSHMPSEEEIYLEKERKQSRQSELESTIQTQRFYDWVASQKERNPGALESDPLCAICLDEFDDDAQVRGLQCCHAFHTHCLDEWFLGFNEFCPLCHRAIIPGRRVAVRRERVERAPLVVPVFMMV